MIEKVTFCSRCGSPLSTDQIAGTFRGELINWRTKTWDADHRAIYCDECMSAHEEIYDDDLEGAIEKFEKFQR